MIFEPQKVFVKSGLAHLTDRVLEFVFPPDRCSLVDSLEEIDSLIQRFAPENKDPHRPLAYHESGAKLI